LSLQSPRARELLREPGVTTAEDDAHDAREPGSIVLLANGRRYERSDAVLHVALLMRMPWPLAFAAILVPRGARDAVYRWIARNRYRWFGRRESCALPPPGLRERFLDDGSADGVAP
jgi:predicted DCC family thiol-disulfide oxidoreductase YuxK